MLKPYFGLQRNGVMTACLAMGSIFTSKSLWTLENARALEKHYSHNLDYGEGDFFQKLEGQLANAPHTAIQLAAEIFWVIYLIVSSRASSGGTKRHQIIDVFSWSGAEIPDDHWALGDVLDQGVAHPGTAYQTHRWRELVFFIDFLLRWTESPAKDRANLLANPWDFSDWLDTVEGAPNRQLPHVLCFLLFPDEFEPITSRGHKQRIITAFAGRLADPRAEEYRSRTELDKAILLVREAISEDCGADFDFYQDELAKIWKPTKKVPPPPDLAEDAAWLKDRFHGKRVWILATSGQGPYAGSSARGSLSVRTGTSDARGARLRRHPTAQAFPVTRTCRSTDIPKNGKDKRPPLRYPLRHGEGGSFPWSFPRKPATPGGSLVEIIPVDRLCGGPRWTKTNGAATAPDETPFRPEDDTRTLAVSEPGGGGGEFLTWSLIGGELPRHTSEDPDVAEDRIP